MREGYVTAEGGDRLYFQESGSGENTLVIPNGFYLLDDFHHLAGGRTLIVYDLRNRGRSDAITDPSRWKRGILQDVDDLDAVRRHFDLESMDLIGHSYVGATVALYAMKYPAHVRRAIQIGPTPPEISKQYPPNLTGADATLQDVFAQLVELEKERQSLEPVEFCRRFWSVLRLIYVVDPADAGRIDWGRCDLPNELHFRKYWIGSVLPSMQNLRLEQRAIDQATVPILTIHGRRDRSAPYGGGREWVVRLPNARLVTVDGAGHAPWIEDSATVFDSIEVFLDGGWPGDAVRVEEIDPNRFE